MKAAVGTFNAVPSPTTLDFQQCRGGTKKATYQSFIRVLITVLWNVFYKEMTEK